MKILLVIVAIAIGAWWYFVGGRKLAEADVRGFYQAHEAATLSRQPDELCALLADGFEASGSVAMGGASLASSQTKNQTCDGYRDLYAAWEKLGEKMGGTVQLDSNYEVSNIKIAADGKSAIAEVSSSLDVAGSIMNIKSRTKDTLIRRNGKVLLLRTEGAGSVGTGS